MENKKTMSDLTKEPRTTSGHILNPKYVRRDENPDDIVRIEIRANYMGIHTYSIYVNGRGITPHPKEGVANLIRVYEVKVGPILEALGWKMEKVN